MQQDFSRYVTAVSYQRFSSKQQRRGHSKERQADAAAAWAAEHHVTLSPLSATDEGLSAFSGKHRKAGALGVLLAALEEGQVPTPALLVIEAVDRLSRLPSTEGLQLIFSGLLAQGCDLLVLERQQLFTKAALDEDMGQLLQLVIDTAAAHAFSKRLSRRMLAAHQKGRERIAAGEVVRVGWTPAWIERHGDHWRLNAYATTIARLVALSQTLGANAVARQLNAEGLLSPRGRKWTQGGVGSVLSSPALAGGRPTRRRDADAIAWGYWPAVISRAEWEALRRRITARDGSPSHGGSQQAVWFIGQGITTCTTCGRPVGNRVCSYVNSSGQKVRVRYARCRGRTDGGCNQPALQLDGVNAALLTRLRSADLARLFPQQRQGQLEVLQAREGVLQAQIEQQEAAIANGQAAIARLLQHAPAAVDAVAQEVTAARATLSRLEADLRAVRLEVEQLTSSGVQVLQAEAQAAVRDLLQAFAADTVTAEQRKAVNQLLRRLGVRVTLDAAGQRLGLAVGDGPIGWQPLTPMAGASLAAGQADVEYARPQVQSLDELLAKVAEAVRSGGSAWIETADGKRVEIGPDGQVVAG